MRRFAAIAVSVCALALAASLLPATAATTPKEIPNWFWGCWEVKKDITPDGVMVGLSPRREKRIIGSRIVFAPSCARYRRVVLRPATYSVKVLSAEDFYDEHHGSGTAAALWEIGIRGPTVTEVEVALPGNLSDLDFPGSTVYLRKDDLVIEVENDFMLAKKAKPADPACACKALEPR